MAKSNITAEQAQAVVDRLTQEFGLLVKPMSGFTKVEGPTNKHRIFIQRSKMLGRIDTTLPVAGQEGTYALSGHNGSITCHIEPDLAHLEKFLKMLGDATLGKQVSNKPRPFAVQKGPAGRSPKAMATPIPEEEIIPNEYVAQGGTLEQRLANIKARVRQAKINRIVEERGVSAAEAEAIIDARVEDGEENHAELSRARERQEVEGLSRESGIEIEH